MRIKLNVITATLIALGTIACGDESKPEETNEQELITRVTLTFVPTGGGSPVEAVWNDPDGDGGLAPTVDTVELASSSTFSVSVGLTNALAEPPISIDEEVEEERADHQLFFTGTGVQSESTGAIANPLLFLSYDYSESGLPLGLQLSATSGSAPGTGTLRVVLRHLPGLKTAGLPATAASSGVDSLPGESDIDVTFPLTVN